MIDNTHRSNGISQRNSNDVHLHQYLFLLKGLALWCLTPLSPIFQLTKRINLFPTILYTQVDQHI